MPERIQARMPGEIPKEISIILYGGSTPVRIAEEVLARIARRTTEGEVSAGIPGDRPKQALGRIPQGMSRKLPG